MRKFFVAVLFFLGLVLVHTTTAVAKETENDKFSFGKVVAVTASDITVKEYDFAKDADVQVTYSVTPETELGNINAVSDLKVDDDIVIDYSEKDGKRVVTTLVKEEKGAEVPNGQAAEGDVTAAPTEEAAPVVPAEAKPAEAAAEAPAAAPEK
jgi:FKBP-type peptidyl-prolyl cis-trans isomerase (trigger factor)